jgi:DNA-binding transcriptional ArsR family regulator
MSGEMTARVAERFRALADPNRLHLLQLFVRKDRGVNELAEAAGLNIANTSKHLAILCKAGLIRRRKEGTRVIYSLDGPLPRQLCALVCEDERTRTRRALKG